jgi:hypothetical protein
VPRNNISTHMDISVHSNAKCHKYSIIITRILSYKGLIDPHESKQWKAPTRSDFIVDQVTRKPPFCHSLHFLWCMAQRSLHAVTNIYYRSMSCFATVSLTQASLAMLRFPLPEPLLHHVDNMLNTVSFPTQPRKIHYL